MKTREYLYWLSVKITKEHRCEILFVGKIMVAGCWENFSGLGKKKGGESETKNQSSDSLTRPVKKSDLFEAEM